MYRVLCDGALICDSRIEELALIDPVVVLEENKAGSFTFTIPPKHPEYNTVKKRKALVQVYLDEETEPLFSGICIDETGTFYKHKKIHCEGELTFFNDSIQRPKRYEGKTVRELLEAYVASHNSQVEEEKQFTVGIVTVKDSNDYISCYTNMEPTMKALKEDLLDDLGGIFRIRHEDTRYLDYLAESPNTNSQTITVGENLLDFSSNIDSTDIATAVIPLGARLEESPVEGLEVRMTIADINNGLDYVYSPEAVGTYGWIYKTVEWDDVATASALKKKGEQYLSNIQWENMVLEAKAIDLHLVDKDIERFKVSDQIRVVSPSHGMDRYFRLTKMTIRLNNPESSTIVLGKKEKLSLSTKTNQANAEARKAVKSVQESLFSSMAQTAKDITAEVNKKVDNSELGTKISQDTENVRAAWNGNSRYIQFENDGISMYDASIEESKKRAVFNYAGEHFYRDGYYVGRIGTNQWSGDDSHKGLVFGLEHNGKYMAFAQKEAEDADAYMAMLCFSRENSICGEYGLHLGCDLYGHNHRISGADLRDISTDGYAAVSKEFKVVTGITQNEDGSITCTYGTVRARNGIITMAPMSATDL